MKHMKKHFLPLLLLLPLAAGAQEEVAARAEQGRLSVGVTVAPEYSSRFAHALDVYGENLWELTGKDERGKASFRAGLSLDYELLPWLSFETGMLYAGKGYHSGEILLRTDENDADGSYGRARLNFHYLSVPLKAKFLVLKGDYPLFVTAGFSPDFFLGRNEKLNGERIAYYEDGGVKFRAVNLCGLVGVGTRHDFTPTLRLEAELGFKSSMMPMNDEPLRRNLYSLGLDVRLYYKVGGKR